MSRVSYFQRFSQRENHATNNTLLAFRYFYQSSPFKIENVLKSLLEDDLSIGLNFEQQVKGEASIPDALIYQNHLRIFVETKRGEILDEDQITRHLKEIAQKDGRRDGDILIGITKEPMPRADIDRFKAEASTYGIKFGAVTFSQIVDALRHECENEADLRAVVEDYAEYLSDESLIEERDQWLVAFACGTSLAENVRLGLYYEPPSRPCKYNRFIGVYSQQAVRFVGAVEAIAVASFEGGTLRVTETEKGTLTEKHHERISSAFAETTYYDLKADPHRFYLVDKFVPTTLKKAAGGVRGYQYLDLNDLISDFKPRQAYSTEDIGKLLDGKIFE